jgi:hypothetical protein
VKYTYETISVGQTVTDKGVTHTVNPHPIKYKITESGTAYHMDTPDELVAALERIRENRTRVRIYYGDSKTGRDWEESYDVFGTIGRSGGRLKIPLTINNSRSIGGVSLLDDAIVKIEYANTKQGGVIWQHPKYYRDMTRGESYLAPRSYHKPSSKPGKKAARRGTTGTSIGGMR